MKANSPSNAAALIRAGELVAFPTETVYGLGANALDPAAIERVFQAKGRPAESPLIVHASSIEMAKTLVRSWPATAQVLAVHFWPGPLTLVLPKASQVPDRVTAGLHTVGIRIPSHPIALALIRAAGVPIAAPSANRFGELSPTTAEHVRQSLGDRVAMVLDGGPTDVGIESTVLSLAGPTPVLLRPGMISQAQIEALIGPVEIASPPANGSHPAPGMHSRHYSPRTPLVLVEGGILPTSGRGAYVPIQTDPREYAAQLYSVLHELDAQGLDWIAVERPPLSGDWAAIRDRLERAASR